MSTSHSEARARVLSAVEEAPAPVTVEELRVITGLHPNTLRGHLDVLLASGEVTRTVAESEGRGRPKWIYTAARKAASPFQFLAEALTSLLERSADPQIAESAAESWAHAIPDLPVADSPDEAVAEAVDALNRLGFTAEASPVGDSIAVTNCPYAALVDEHPVICDIHAAMVGRLLVQTGQPVSVESLELWTRPDMCVARLRRPDLTPTRTIAIDDRGIVTAEGK